MLCEVNTSLLDVVNGGFFSVTNIGIVRIATAVIYCYITTEFHYAKRNSRLSFQHMDVLELRSVIFVKKIHASKMSAKIFPHA